MKLYYGKTPEFWRRFEAGGTGDTNGPIKLLKIPPGVYDLRFRGHTPPILLWRVTSLKPSNVIRTIDPVGLVLVENRN